MPPATLRPNLARKLPTSAAGEKVYEKVYETASVAPNRTLQQRQDALAKANVVRMGRAELKREIKRGDKSPVVILFDPPEFIEGMKVFDFLMAMPKFGRVKINKVLAYCRISPSKSIGGMSDRQRHELISAIQNRP